MSEPIIIRDPSFHPYVIMEGKGKNVIVGIDNGKRSKETGAVVLSSPKYYADFSDAVRHLVTRCKPVMSAVNKEDLIASVKQELKAQQDWVDKTKGGLKNWLLDSGLADVDRLRERNEKLESECSGLKVQLLRMEMQIDDLKKQVSEAKYPVTAKPVKKKRSVKS